MSAAVACLAQWRRATADPTDPTASPPTPLQALEYITDDELVEVTPQSIRIRKDPSAVNKRGVKR